MPRADFHWVGGNEVALAREAGQAFIEAMHEPRDPQVLMICAALGHVCEGRVIPGGCAGRCSRCGAGVLHAAS